MLAPAAAFADPAVFAQFAEPALVAYATLFAESAVLSTLPRPTSAFEYEGFVGAFAHAYTSAAFLAFDSLESLP